MQKSCEWAWDDTHALDMEVNMTVNKAERFKDIATMRTRRVLEDINRLKSLASRKNYEYTPEQVAAIFDAIQIELEEVKMCFEPQDKSKKLFTL